MVWVQMPPASAWKMVSRPMNTTTIDSTGALCSGRRIVRSMTTPMTKDSTITTGSAIQKLMPHSRNCQVR